MTSRSLYRAAAIALGFAAFTVSGYLAHPAADVGEMAGPAWQVSHMLLWMGGLAAAFGIVGLYLRHRQRVGRAGTLGAGAAILGLLGLTGAYFHESIIVPALAQQAPELMRTFPGDGTWASYRIAVASSGAAVGVGFALFGVKMIRTRAVPIWAAATTSLGALGAGLQFALPSPMASIAFLLLGLGLIGLAYELAASSSTSPATPLQPGEAS